MSDITIWHLARCTKSRQGLAFLRERGIEPAIRTYLTDPPSETELRAAQKMLGLPAIAMMRTKEATFRELGLSRDSDEATLIRAMAENPVLIERPIVFRGGKAVIARPTEAISTLL